MISHRFILVLAERLGPRQPGGSSTVVIPFDLNLWHKVTLGLPLAHPHLYRRKQGLDKIGFHIDGMLILDAQ
jgi:hypothetical protein